MSDGNIAQRLFDAAEAESDLQGALDDAGVEYERLGWDSYDCSLEIYGVASEHRLSADAQRAIFEAGFVQVYVNHEDKWETHYVFDAKDAADRFGEGWRVSYPMKRGEPDGKILVERHISSWPQEWFDTGYVQIVPPAA